MLELVAYRLVSANVLMKVYHKISNGSQISLKTLSFLCNAAIILMRLNIFSIPTRSVYLYAVLSSTDRSCTPRSANLAKRAKIIENVQLFYHRPRRRQTSRQRVSVMEVSVLQAVLAWLP